MKLTAKRNPRKTLSLVLTLVVVFSALGAVGTVTAQEVTVTQSTTSTTAAPGDTVTLQTTINATDVNGQGLQIQLPSGWLGTWSDGDGGSAKPVLGEQANLLQVVWLSPGEYTVTYEVDVPADATAGDYTVDVEGSAVDPDTSDRIVTSTQTTIAVEEPDQNTPPTADAGDDQTVSEGDSVTLDATGSSDPEGDTLSHQWTQTAGSSVTLSDDTSATPSFTAPDVDANETLAFQVEVADGNGSTDTDTVNVTVQNVPEPNQDPIADAGDDQTVSEGEEVTLDATGSSDPDGDSLSYSWKTPDIGVGVGIDLSNDSSPTPSFTAPEVDMNQTVTLELTVDDGNGGTDIDTVKIHIQDVEDNAAPTADAGLNQTVDEGDAVTLDGTNSGDPDGDTLSYQWIQTGGPDVPLDDNTSASPSFTAPEVDSDQMLTFELEVSDGNGGTDTSAVNVIVLDDPPLSDSPSSAVSLSPESDEVVIGETTTYDVVVESADGGVGAYTVTVSLDNTTPASITDVALAHDPALTEVSYAEDNSSVTITAALMDTNDTGSVSLASITVEGVAEGSSNLTPDVQALGDESGESYTVSAENSASISVIELIVGDFQNQVNDVDDDGLYEDVNGDGTFNIVDVQALFANLEDQTVLDNADKFDFNGDGQFNVVDVQALFNELDTES